MKRKHLGSEAILLSNEINRSRLSLTKEDFRSFDFVIYRLLRLLLIPLGKRISVILAIHLHWIFRHLAIATSSRFFESAFLNSRSAIVQSSMLERHTGRHTVVVEVACGTARYLNILKQLDIPYYLGIDSSETHIKRNKVNYPEVQFEVGDALRTENIPQSDVLIASHFLEHLDSPETYLKEMARKTKKVIAEVPDFFSDPINSVSYIMGAPWWTDRDHRREYSQEQIARLFHESGYQVQEVAIYGGTIGVVAIPNT